MARDRQRAKQRRRNRQPGSGGPASGSGRTRARDVGLEPTEAELDSTAAPEPTKHAFPDVEEARIPHFATEADACARQAAFGRADALGCDPYPLIRVGRVWKYSESHQISTIFLRNLRIRRANSRGGRGQIRL